MAKTVTRKLKSKPKKSWGIGVNFIKKVSPLTRKSFGFFEALFGIYAFGKFENSPLFSASSKWISTRKYSSNNLEIKFTPIPIFALKMMGEHRLNSRVELKTKKEPV